MRPEHRWRGPDRERRRRQPLGQLAGGICLVFSSALSLGLAAADGPPIGVLIAEGRGVELSLELSPGREGEQLLVQSETTLERLAAGSYLLRLEGSAAALARSTEPTAARIFEGQPFRLRGAASTTTRIVVAGAPQVSLLVEGWVEVLPPDRDGGAWRVVNRLPLERYLRSVVGAEMPASFPGQALEAQAIASRTFALYQLVTRSPEARWHVHRDVRSQVYRGAEAPAPAVAAAVERTRGQVLGHGPDRRIFEACFHSTCGGATASGYEVFRTPPIQPLAGGVQCGDRSRSPQYAWEAEVPGPDLVRALAPLCRQFQIGLGDVQSIQGVEPGPGGRASYVRIEHAKGSFELDGERFRAALGYSRIRSTAFACQREAGGTFRFTGRGHGHGVGLCQWGAAQIAQDGYDAIAILQFYYPGAEVMALWE